MRITEIQRQRETLRDRKSERERQTDRPQQKEIQRERERDRPHIDRVQLRVNQRGSFTSRERESNQEMGIREMDPKTETEMQRIGEKHSAQRTQSTHAETETGRQKKTERDRESK